MDLVGLGISPPQQVLPFSTLVRLDRHRARDKASGERGPNGNLGLGWRWRLRRYMLFGLRSEALVILRNLASSVSISHLSGNPRGYAFLRLVFANIRHR